MCQAGQYFHYVCNCGLLWSLFAGLLVGSGNGGVRVLVCKRTKRNISFSFVRPSPSEENGGFFAILCSIIRKNDMNVLYCGEMVMNVGGKCRFVSASYLERRVFLEKME